MSMTVNITIKGIALCFRKRGNWNIDFICDNDHPLLFEEPQVRPTELRVAGVDFEMEFVNQGIDVKPPEPATVSNLFNMASTYAHGDVDSHGRKILIEKRNKNNTDRIRLIIPSATLSTLSVTPRPYYVQDIKSSGLPVKIIGPVAKELKATFTVDRDINSPLLLKTNLYGSTPREYPYQDGTILDFVFDNDCKGSCTENDFLGVYEMIHDISGRKIAAGQIQAVADVKGVFAEWLLEEGFQLVPHKSAKIMVPDSGNCDPIGIEPPPGD